MEKHLVSDFTDDILRVGKVDTSQDDPEIHPQRFCILCKNALKRALDKLSKGEDFKSTGGCGAGGLFTWSSHKETGCNTCAQALQNSGGGRPPAGNKLQGIFSSDMTSTTDMTSESTVSALDIEKEDFLSRLLPSFKHKADLSSARFLTPLSSLTCEICSNIVDQPVQAPCCKAFVLCDMYI